MRLSVIVPAYNRERYVVSALRSLLRQRDAADLDIIVVDDGSTDGTAEAVRAMMGENPCIRLFQQANMGIAKARNAGLSQLLPQTRFVSFLDSDDISPIGRFKADLACFEADPGLDLAYSLIMQADRIDEETLEPAAGRLCITVRGVSLAAGIYSRNLVDRIGGFDEDFVQGEDIDYLLRLFERSSRYVLPDTVAVYYRRHAGNVTKEHDAKLRGYLHAMHKSMKRRKADPSLRQVEGIFELKDQAAWQSA
ncbi:MAG: glycosyltransferase family A protein [Mesorhizobium sp.]